MTRRFTRILAALALLVGLTIPLGMWGQAPVNTVLWGETWTDGGNAQPSDYGFTGTTVYGNATLTYANSSTSTKLYNEALAGGTAPELLLAKNNSTWTITGIPSGSATGLTLSFKANYDRTVVSTTTEGVTVGTKAFSNNTVSYPISVASNVSSFVLVFTNTNSGNVRIDDIQLVVTTAGGGQQLTSTTTTITAPESFNNDLYVGTSAGTLTASVTETNGGAAVSGATVTWSSTNTSVATVDANGAVTLVAVGTTNITATYAGNTTYAPSTGTYQLNVVDNTPFDGVIFTSGTDIGSTTSNGSPDEMTKENVRIYGSDAAFATAEYRMYKNSTTTISTTDGSTITKIEFTNASSNPATGFANQTGWTTNNNGGVWEGEATSVSFVASNAQVRATLVKVTVTPNTNPLITADDVNISYDATSGSIVYTINNEPDPAGTLAASVPQNSWLTLGTVGATVPFTCAANMSRTARTETVTLTYTYNTNETVTKEVTVTQAGNPNVFDNISDINAVGTAYIVKGTVVATNSRGFIIGDGTGYVYTYLNDVPTFGVNDMVTVSGTMGNHSHVLQFTSSATVAAATSSNYDGTPAVTVITEIPDYTQDNHLSTYLQFEGELTQSSSNYFITVGDEDIQISYPTTAQTTTLDGLVNKTVRVKGYFAAYNSSNYFTVMMESMEEVTDPYITIESDEFELTANEEEGYLEITYGNLPEEYSFNIQCYDAEGNELDECVDWLGLAIEAPEEEEGDFVYYFASANQGSARTAYFKVYASWLVEIDGDVEIESVYSNLVTVTQAAPVHNYAELPFEWNQFSSTPVGITNQGVSVGGNNYDYLKFDNAGDYIILHFNEQPGILTFDIKGNTNGQAWAGEFKVQTSEDGETYTDIRYYSTDDELPTSSYSDQTIATINKNVRYIKWIYVTKTNGNIAIDNINLAKPVIETIGYPFTNNQWYLIASPLGDVAPADVANMTTGSYALYRFDQQGDNEGKEWINYKNSTDGVGFDLKFGNGYLYANQNAGTLTFTGATIPYMDDGICNVLPLEYEEGVDFPGYNLLGNPFNQTVWTDWDIYVMDENSNNIIPSTSRSIAPMQGFFVIATDVDFVVTLYDNEPEGGDKGASVALNVSRNRGNVIDRAIVRMGEGRQLPKFQLFEGSTKVYIPQGDQDYAVVRSEGQGELPVNFHASENGTYSLSMDVENMDMNYLHLIDNMTGMDVDLLQTPSYTFEAKVNDYESRFRLVFAANNEDGVSTGSTTFAFYSNGNWIINNVGDATLQVIDVTGRVLSSETVSGSVSETINAVPGVYMLRLINGDNVNVQKIVVR